MDRVLNNEDFIFCICVDYCLQSTPSLKCRDLLPGYPRFSFFLMFITTAHNRVDMLHSPGSTDAVTVSQVKGLFTTSLDLAAKLSALKVSK